VTLRALTMPEGFGEAIARREKVALDLHEGRNANPEGTLAVQVALHKATVRLLAGEALGGLDPADDAVTLRSSWAVAGRIPAGHYQTIPGNLVMFVLLSAMTYGTALLAVERRNGTLRRLASSPLSRTEIIAGKLLGRICVACVQGGVFLVIGLTLFRIDWGSSPVGLAALLATFIFCAGAIGLLGGTLFASPEASSGVGVTLTLIMSAFGGCWWPSEVMPAWLRTASYAFPSAWAVNGLHEILSWGGGWNDVLPHCAVLALMGLAAGAIAARRLRLD
jgi:ABC-type multidrug transport system permease subunit